MTRAFVDPAVADAFGAFPDDLRPTFMALRQMIYDVAAETPGAGPIEETLKWGQPAYLTPKTKSGTTLRLGTPKTGGAAIYAHCQTPVISDFQAAFPDAYTFEGNRAVHLGAEAPDDRLRLLIAAALTYHRR